MKANYDDARDALRHLTSHNHQSFLAGGCVRDMLLGRPVNDFDITTAATPEQVQSIFPKTVPVGASFGVVKVLINGGELDVATFRTDGAYSDNRRPDSVAYTASAEEDVKRRDFTINGMLMDENERVIDYVGGQIDLKCRLIKTIGDPADRFGEDALRMLRAVRFAVKLGFEIHRDTQLEIIHLVSTLKHISKERITDELSKAFTCGRSDQAFWLLNKFGIWDQIFGCRVSDDDKWGAMYGLGHLNANDPFTMSIATILADTYDSNQENVLAALCFTNMQKAEVKRLLVQGPKLSNFLHEDLPTQRKMLAWEDNALIQRFVEINQNVRKMQWTLTGDEVLANVYSTMSEVRAMGWPGPLVNGNDLITWGWIQGPIFSAMLNSVRDAQLNGDLQDKEQVKPFLLLQFPAAAYKLSNGEIQDGMRRRRMVAQCKKCHHVMSFTVEFHAKGQVNWSTVEDKIGVRCVGPNSTFTECENCGIRKKKSKFVKAVE